MAALPFEADALASGSRALALADRPQRASRAPAPTRSLLREWSTAYPDRSTAFRERDHPPGTQDHERPALHPECAAVLDPDRYRGQWVRDMGRGQGIAAFAGRSWDHEPVRMMQRNPMWPVDVSTSSPWRAACHGHSATARGGRTAVFKFCGPRDNSTGVQELALR
jgi:hypothetical protein